MSAATVVEMWVSLDHDPDPDVSYLTDAGRWANKKDEESDRKRLRAFEAGQWMMIGVVVKAHLLVEGIVQEMSSGGVWGVESDSGKAYLSELAKEEYEQLTKILKKLGVKKIPAFTSMPWRKHY